MRFVLVHGGFHAAWCWSRTIPELERLGHAAAAVDLPGHGDLLDEESTLDNRRDAIVSALQPGDVLVGHSGGGFDATLAADAATDLVSHIVYLAAGRAASGTTAEVVRTPVLSALYGHHVDVLRVHGRVLVVAGAAGELADTSDPAHIDSQVEIIA